jgi:hypothetical protein
MNPRNLDDAIEHIFNAIWALAAGADMRAAQQAEAREVRQAERARARDARLKQTARQPRAGSAAKLAGKTTRSGLRLGKSTACCTSKR